MSLEHTDFEVLSHPLAPADTRLDLHQSPDIHVCVSLTKSEGFTHNALLLTEREAAVDAFVELQHALATSKELATCSHFARRERHHIKAAKVLARFDLRAFKRGALIEWCAVGFGMTAGGCDLLGHLAMTIGSKPRLDRTDIVVRSLPDGPRPRTVQRGVRVVEAIAFDDFLLAREELMRASVPAFRASFRILSPSEYAIAQSLGLVSWP